MALFSYFTYYDILHSIFFSQSLLILLFVTIICRYLQHKWQHRHMYNLVKKLDGPKPLPIIGNALMFSGSQTDIMTNILNLFNTYKAPVKITIGSHLVVGFTKPEHIKTVLSKTIDKGQFYNFITEYIKNGLLSAPVPIWRKHRKIIQPTFNQKILDTFVSVFNEHSVSLIKVLEKETNNNYFEVYPYLMNCALDSVCENALGVKMNSQSGDRKVINCVTRITKIWLHPNIIFSLTSLGKEYQERTNYLNNFCMNIIKERRKEYENTINGVQDNVKKEESEFEKHKLKRKPFLQLLLECSDFSNEEILDEVLTIVFGATESISTTTGFCLMTLGMFPEHQEKVYEEINNIFGNSDRPVQSSDLPHLAYLERFIKETMRIFSIVPFIARVVTEEFQIDEYTLPKGCTVAVPMIHVHRDPELWPNPKQFDPDRFLPENCAVRHQYSYLPFSYGMRNCIGLNYANMLIKTMLINIVRNYRIVCDKKIDDIRLYAAMVTKPTDGFFIAISKR